jgi:anti-sigma factor RsiW
MTHTQHDSAQHDLAEHDFDWNDRLQDWLDGELDPGEQARFDAHLAGCARCTGGLARLQALDLSLRSAAPPPTLDSAFDAKLFAEIDKIDEARRAAARERVQAEIQTELKLLTQNWRRTLGLIVPGVIAGIALAFALAGYFDTAEWTRELATKTAGEIGPSTASFIHMLMTSVVGAAIGYVVARWLTPATE